MAVSNVPSTDDFGVMKEAQFLEGTSQWALDWYGKWIKEQVDSLANLSQVAKQMADQLPAVQQAAATATKANMASLPAQATQTT